MCIGREANKNDNATRHGAMRHGAWSKHGFPGKQGKGNNVMRHGAWSKHRGLRGDNGPRSLRHALLNFPE
eukprot:1158425-Pelagomonas_calceolata.AAC.6